MGLVQKTQTINWFERCIKTKHGSPSSTFDMFDDTLIKIVEIKWFIIIDQRVLILPSCYLNKTANGVHHLIIWTNPNVILPDPRFHFKGGFLASNATLPEAT